ncbi:hypothetical protein RU639_006242 [Aspergillus parasiticus]
MGSGFHLKRSLAAQVKLCRCTRWDTMGHRHISSIFIDLPLRRQHTKWSPNGSRSKGDTASNLRLTEVGLQDAERLRSSPVPKTTFATLWLLLKPGGVKWNSWSERSGPYVVNIWNLNFDGQRLTRSVKNVYIPILDHAREINSLPLFPVQFHVDVDPQYPLYQQLVDRGKRFVEMVKRPTFQEYSGSSRMQGIRTVSVKRRAFDDYDNIYLNSQDTLSDHQYLLCSSHVYAYVLKDRAWDVLEVPGLRNPKIDKNIIDSLVLKPESNKEMIKAVCDIFGATYPQAFSSDLVRGKGKGQILLLHGPPGTGKTLTAESVAEYTGQPLLSITAADLGHEPQ